jgi:FKBP-type peptidyl-prolyl cis-trans isomerase
VDEFYAAFARGEKDSEWVTTPSGLKYIILEASKADRKPQPGELVRAHYYGVFAADGKFFDGSFGRGSTLDFTLGQHRVIPGWEEGFALLDKGDKAMLLIPSALAYGKRGYPGAIPPDADLIFYVELAGIGELD